jgi:hypothetical protein
MVRDVPGADSSPRRPQGRPRFTEVTIFHIDYDRQKHIMRLLGASVRSQMIAFHGESEFGHLVSETDPDLIEAFLLALVAD